MSRTLQTTEVHSTNLGQYNIHAVITPDGHKAAFIDATPKGAAEQAAAWLATLPLPDDVPAVAP